MCINSGNLECKQEVSKHKVHEYKINQEPEIMVYTSPAPTEITCGAKASPAELFIHSPNRNIKKLD